MTLTEVPDRSGTPPSALSPSLQLLWSVDLRIDEKASFLASAPGEGWFLNLELKNGCNSYAEQNTTSEEEQPHAPSGCPESTTRSFANGSRIKTVVDQMFQILTHSNLNIHNVASYNTISSTVLVSSACTCTDTFLSAVPRGQKCTVDRQQVDTRRHCLVCKNIPRCKKKMGVYILF